MIPTFDGTDDQCLAKLVDLLLQLEAPFDPLAVREIEKNINETPSSSIDPTESRPAQSLQRKSHR